MLLDVSPGRTVVGKDEQPSNHRCIPRKPFARDPGPEADLDVVPPKGLFDRRQLGLELDHQERSRCLVPRQYVDRPAFPVHGVRHLGLDDPASVQEPPDYCLGERCVTRVEQVIERSATPSDEDNDIRIEYTEQSAKSSQRHGLDAAALEERNLILTAPRAHGDVRLAHAEPLPQDSRDPTDP